MTCPGCAAPTPSGLFLCLTCADVTPDPLIVQIGAAIDAGDTETAARVIGEAVDQLEV